MPKPTSTISFVIPCLNEEKTLPSVLSTITEVAGSFRDFEIVVADNGSYDRSKDIAQEYGAKVVDVSEKGYGAALLGGIHASRMELVCFADADNTYDFAETLNLVIELERSNHSIVLGNRLGGTIEPGAMPLLHRYIGTPALSIIISLLIRGRLGMVKDCNSGFRVFRRSDFLRLGIKSKGMEFASEMLIRYLQASHSMGWVPVTLRKDAQGRVPHLKTWRDGMRHLLQILVEAPDFFKKIGASLISIGLIVWIASLIFDTVKLGPFSVLGLHTLTLAVFTCLAGIQFIGIYLILSSSNKDIPNPIITMREDILLWLSSVSISVSALIWVVVFYRWSALGYSQLGLEKWAITGLGVGAIGFYSVTQLIIAQLARRTNRSQ